MAFVSVIPQIHNEGGQPHSGFLTAALEVRSKHPSPLSVRNPLGFAPPISWIDRCILADKSACRYECRPPERESLFASSRTVAASNKTDSESGWLVSR